MVNTQIAETLEALCEEHDRVNTKIFNVMVKVFKDGYKEAARGTGLEDTDPNADKLRKIEWKMGRNFEHQKDEFRKSLMELSEDAYKAGRNVAMAAIGRNEEENNTVFRVGDEITRDDGTEKVIISRVDSEGNLNGVTAEGEAYYILRDDILLENWHKTGRRFALEFEEEDV